MTFDIGSVVQLKGGSPIMTVTGTVKDREGKVQWTCTWMDQSDKEQFATYRPEALKMYEEEMPPGIPTEHDYD
jgi:uncharacterized protein YodC (DUF2158 family)